VAESLEQEPVEQPRELWPEEAEDAASRSKAKSYFHQHPAAKWVLLFLVLALIGAGTWLWHYYGARESTDDAQVDAHIAPVSARVSGTVNKVLVDNNTFVKAGTVLVELDPKDYQVAVDKARADLADAQAAARAARTSVPITTTSTHSGVDIAHAAVAASQKQVAAAKARLAEAQANHTRAAQDLKRMSELVAKQEVSRQEYDTAVAAEKAAAATVEAAAAGVSSAESQVTQTEAQLQQAQTAPQQVAVTEARAGAAEASVGRAQANLDQAELNLQYTTIRAPVDGIVSKRNVEPGQVVQPGQPLMSIVDLDNVWVTANFKETQLKDMRAGQKAAIHVDAYDHDLNGFVESIGGGTGAVFSLLPPENATGNYVKVVQRVPVRIFFDKGQDTSKLRPGMSVVVTAMTK
jgi:membrane fusion protein, multidrug efflux system